MQSGTDGHIDAFEKVREVYRRLGDKLSRKMFMARLNYNLTGDFSDMYRILMKMSKRDGAHDLLSLFRRNLPEQKDTIALYGMNRRVKMLYNSITSLGIKISFIVKEADEKSSSPQKYPDHVKIISIDELVNEHSDAKVIIGVAAYSGIRKTLLSRGFTDEQIYLRKTKKFTQYFEKDIFTLGKDEVFVDGGCWNMGDSATFIKWANNSYGAVYAFEPDPGNFQNCISAIAGMPEADRNKCTVFPAGLWSEERKMLFSSQGSVGSRLTNDGDISVDLTSIDTALRDKRVTFIKMDIEGAELEALKGAQETIRKYRPRLAICIYHKPEDLITLPLYILSLVPDYKLYIRHYTTFTCETVLYCV